MRKFHAERLVKGKSTRGQVMCLAQMETKADDQGQKALQAWVRSLYGAPIWPSITSRYKKLNDIAPVLAEDIHHPQSVLPRSRRSTVDHK